MYIICNITSLTAPPPSARGVCVCMCVYQRIFIDKSYVITRIFDGAGST